MAIAPIQRGDPALGDGECYALGGDVDAELVPCVGEDALEVAFGIAEALGEAGVLLAVGGALQAGELHLVGHY